MYSEIYADQLDFGVTVCDLTLETASGKGSEQVRAAWMARDEIERLKSAKDEPVWRRTIAALADTPT